jgi:hypothetical protein
LVVVRPVVRRYRLVSAVAILALVLTACNRQTTPEGLRCADPTSSEVEVESLAVLKVEPSPVARGSGADLSVERGSVSENAVVGVAAFWECWTEEQGWVATHVLVRGYGDRSPAVLEYDPDSNAFVELVALAVPNTYPILIPDVRPGTYRIRDEVADVVEDTPARITGFVLVEVLGSEG